MTTKLEKAKSLIGKTIVIDDDPNSIQKRTLKVELVCKVPFDQILYSWSWPEKKEYLCVVGTYTFLMKATNDLPEAIMNRETKAIIYHKNLVKHLLP